jgi:hypothetical protein
MAIATLSTLATLRRLRLKVNEVIGVANASTRTVTADFSIVSTDELIDTIYVDSATSVTCTLPNDLSVGLMVAIVQVGAGTVSFTAESGGTRNSRGGLVDTAGQYAIALVLVHTNTSGSNAAWIVGGDIA